MSVALSLRIGGGNGGDKYNHLNIKQGKHAS